MDLDGVISWWTDRPWWVRIGIGLAMIAWGVVVIVNVARDDNPFTDHWPLIGGGMLAGVGFVLLMIGGKSDAEKKGYKF